MTGSNSDALTLVLEYILVRNEVPTLHTEREFHSHVGVLNQHCWTHKKLAPDQHNAAEMSFQCSNVPVVPLAAKVQNKMTQPDRTPTQLRGTGRVAHSTCFRCFFSSIASGSGRGGRISAFVGAITCREKRSWR